MQIPSLVSSSHLTFACAHGTHAVGAREPSSSRGGLSGRLDIWSAQVILVSKITVGRNAHLVQGQGSATQSQHQKKRWKGCKGVKLLRVAEDSAQVLEREKESGI